MSYVKNKKEKKKNIRHECCNDMNFSESKGYCLTCGTIGQVYSNELDYMENDEYQTNVLNKSKKIHIPYKYLKNNFPEIKNEKIYDFILQAIQIIQDYYKLKRKPYAKYVPYLYNYYQEDNSNIPIIKNFIKNKSLVLEQEITNKLNELTNNKKSNIIKPNNINAIPKIENLSKYYYFNKSKNN